MVRSESVKLALSSMKGSIPLLPTLSQSEFLENELVRKKLAWPEKAMVKFGDGLKTTPPLFHVLAKTNGISKEKD